VSQGAVSKSRQGRFIAHVAGAVALLLAVAAPSAPARNLYVADGSTGSRQVTVIDTATNQVVGAPIEVGLEPFGIAITPDGTRAYVVNTGSDTVSVIDTATNQVVGAPIGVGDVPLTIAITPDGTRAYVANFESESVSGIDTRTSGVLTIPVGKEPGEVAITPDGSRAYVANFGAESVSVIGTATNTVLATLSGGFSNPFGMALKPDGSRLYVAESSVLKAISVIDPKTDQPSPSIAGVDAPEFLAVAPDGGRLYATDAFARTLSVIDTQTNQVLSAIDVGNQPITPVPTPDGSRIYLSRGVSGVVAIDARTHAISAPIGSADDGTIAIVPDQPPVADFAAARARPGVPVALDASASKDPDGTIATYAWAFGDNQNAGLAQPATKHAYARPGKYRATLTLTDNEGCSTAIVFTGQTAYCNGSAAATTTRIVKVAYPGVRVRCPKRAGAGGCRFKLRAVTRKRGKIKAQSAPAGTKVKAGKSAIVSLKPKKAFRAKLARAKKTLVEVTVVTRGDRTTRVRKLKIVQ
jgi:YVTN family beta-propeller protein